MTLTTLLDSAAILLFAYLVRGVSGFGSGLLAVPLLAHFWPLTLAVPLLLVTVGRPRAPGATKVTEPSRGCASSLRPQFANLAEKPQAFAPGATSAVGCEGTESSRTSTTRRFAA